MVKRKGSTTTKTGGRGRKTAKVEEPINESEVILKRVEKEKDENPKDWTTRVDALDVLALHRLEALKDEDYFSLFVEGGWLEDEDIKHPFFSQVSFARKLLSRLNKCEFFKLFAPAIDHANAEHWRIAIINTNRIVQIQVPGVDMNYFEMHNCSFEEQSWYMQRNESTTLRIYEENIRPVAESQGWGNIEEKLRKRVAMIAFRAEILPMLKGMGMKNEFLLAKMLNSPQVERFVERREWTMDGNPVPVETMDEFMGIFF